MIEPISNDSENDSILACQDRVIRFLQGSELSYDLSLEGPIQTVERFPPNKKLTKPSLDK